MHCHVRNVLLRSFILVIYQSGFAFGSITICILVVLMHVFGDRPFVDHYSWSPPLTQEINRPVCNAATKALSICLPALKIFQCHVSDMYVTVNGIRWWDSD